VLVVGSYSRKQSSPLYIADTIGKAVEVSCSAVGGAAIVKSGLAAGRVVRVCSFSCRRSSKSRLAASKQQGVSQCCQQLNIRTDCQDI
jgi:hypothetical protein